MVNAEIITIIRQDLSETEKYGIYKIVILINVILASKQNDMGQYVGQGGGHMVKYIIEFFFNFK